MLLYFVVFAILWMPVTLQSVKKRSFLAKPSCDDRISNIEFVAEHQAPSRHSCAAMCDINCGCFGFNSLVKKCRIHRSCVFVNMISTEDGWRYYQISAPPDCHGVMETGERTSGLYVIDPFGGRQQPATVYCDMETDDGGWTAIQRRLRGTMKFDKTWTEFKNGFGDPPNAYWIGNDVIHHLTNRQPHFLYVLFKLNNGSIFHQKYENFSIGDESTNYTLHLGGPNTGNLGDSMISNPLPTDNVNGTSFSTVDRDNDQLSGHCSTSYKGGWWFNACSNAFLNGPWPPEYWKEPWVPTITTVSNIAEVRMMIKPT
ncbi:fibrinogen-like protein A [Magallana gigas]|uniref:Fibrinogen C-terminal domain-containing protein n=1 Tax=Magallana gigas TaxID=29159 RepID=A0A8W8NT01_MAGGI|nr:angiopoietin-2 [Crassostrea gigas]